MNSSTAGAGAMWYELWVPMTWIWFSRGSLAVAVTLPAQAARASPNRPARRTMPSRRIPVVLTAAGAVRIAWFYPNRHCVNRPERVSATLTPAPRSVHNNSEGGMMREGRHRAHGDRLMQRDERDRSG